MQNNGQYISWQHLVDLYHKHRGDGTTPRPGLSILHKIKMEHIQLTSYSKMRVDLAAQVKQNFQRACMCGYICPSELDIGVE